MAGRDERDQARKLHQTVGMVGLRAQATAVGFLQLCHELLQAGVLDDDAIGRIKGAIAKDILVSNENLIGRGDFEASVTRRLDALFPAKSDKAEHQAGLGTADEMQNALGIPDDGRD